MIRFFAAILVGCLGVVSTASAEEARRYLGQGLLLTNDSFGDFKDRWRTGSIQASHVWGPTWSGQMPQRFGQLIELRWGGQVMAPASLSAPNPTDRPYAGALFAGLHTHFRRGAADMSLGTDLVMTGPQTGLDDLQQSLHDLLGVAGPSPGVRANQIDDGLHPTLVFEIGRDISLGSSATLHPFVEGRWGDETLVRAGADLVFGQVGQGALMVRDMVSGHRYRAVQPSFRGGGAGAWG
ncbi:lipid A deacylase LpxR family protein [Lutimaribacter sp. EGI FJ00015]|uniref:Lipid A deacylase LpxR family protein n=1 Tax=Lutimaribacter degradans TaxID=2945989 RepID=A0ACC5ZYL8_9RHOB|nr:lipid A-modifier LpxR family protein [Lutimaribacter sp. EGI FJ00013]MCM2562644.1 lipid A deacylase LpxR family protein [Lutimaribacter sp. EGI FJ00013]MCO0613801.1 lipid A deacylase LpxR family protein [Lutimaribacter sp. EGI FJ00015]MCO0636716.1 lipid A deacylase LpxR family protein [Lutimaribacter sp. EGI FJ00014]